MSLNFKKKIFFYRQVLEDAIRTGAYGTLFDFLLYRTPLALAWTGWHGHRFHRSTLFWFQEREGIHTRAVFLLPRLRHKHPDLKKTDILFEFYNEQGLKLAQMTQADQDISDLYILESNHLPKGLDIPAPFSGTLVVKFKLHGNDRAIRKAQNGLFASAYTFIDYYSAGDFVTTVHDYNAFLPDQGINRATLGMIPAYSDDEKETFILFHAAAAGIGARDLRVVLFNGAGDSKSVWFEGLKPFAMRKAALSSLFPDAAAFLGGGMGQVQIEGFWRQLLRRTAYGLQYAGSSAFSIDHCLYSDYGRMVSFPAGAVRQKSKSIFSPFLVVENANVSTAALLYQSRKEIESRVADLLLYDEEGRCVATLPRFVELSGDRVARLSMREILESRGILRPFVGHAELVFHRADETRPSQPVFEHAVEYSSNGRLAHVIHGADFWNRPEAVRNDRYFSVNRIVCDQTQTTYMAISNCSYAFEYGLTVPFRLNLIAGGNTVAQGEFRIGPNATIYQPIEYFFPDAEKLLASSRGVGFSAITNVNCDFLTVAFLTEDRLTRTVSAEHSLGWQLT